MLRGYPQWTIHLSAINRLLLHNLASSCPGAAFLKRFKSYNITIQFACQVPIKKSLASLYIVQTLTNWREKTLKFSNLPCFDCNVSIANAVLLKVLETHDQCRKRNRHWRNRPGDFRSPIGL